MGGSEGRLSAEAAGRTDVAVTEKAKNVSKRKSARAPRERLRREDPARTGPIRNWSGLFRYQEPTRTSDESADEATDRGGGFVADGVRLAYKIADEQIEQGRRIAEQINDRQYDVKAVGNDLRELSERTIRYSMDLTALWFELLGSLPETLMRLPGAPGKPFRGRPSGGSSRRDAAEPRPPRAGRSPEAHWIEVASHLPARVTLDLRPGTETRPLATHGLQTKDGKALSLRGVSFVRPQAGQRPGVKLQVAPDAAPGLYSGVVFDRESGAAVGTISVRLSGG